MESIWGVRKRVSSNSAPPPSPERSPAISALTLFGDALWRAPRMAVNPESRPRPSRLPLLKAGVAPRVSFVNTPSAASTSSFEHRSTSLIDVSLSSCERPYASARASRIAPSRSWRRDVPIGRSRLAP